MTARYLIEHYSREGHVRWEDLDDINALNAKAFGQPPMTREYFNNVFLTNPMLIFVIARDAETLQIVGKWSCYVLPLDYGGDDAIRGWTEQVVVKKDLQGLGIGKKIWKKVCWLANKKKVAIHDLSSSKEDAQEFYRKRGFVERTTRVFRHISRRKSA